MKPLRVRLKTENTAMSNLQEIARKVEERTGIEPVIEGDTLLVKGLSAGDLDALWAIAKEHDAWIERKSPTMARIEV